MKKHSTSLITREIQITGGSLKARSLRPAWPHGETPSLLKYKNYSRVLACTCSPSYSGAEAGESLEPRRRRLQRAEIMPLHSSLADRARLCLKKEKKSSTERSAYKLRLGFEGWGGLGHMETMWEVVILKMYIFNKSSRGF